MTGSGVAVEVVVSFPVAGKVPFPASGSWVWFLYWQVPVLNGFMGF